MESTMTRTTRRRTARRMTMKLLCLAWLVSSCTGEEDWTTNCLQPCKCKWASGKKTAECTKQNLTKIPNALSPDVQHLDLSGNRLTHIKHNAFKRVHLVNLHKLFLRECEIETVHKDAFNGLEIVIEIDLSGNNITALTPGTFAETKRLRILLLNQNRIEALGKDLFHDLEYLQKITLSDNHISHIGAETFRGLPKFGSLALNGNNLSNVMLQSFEGLTGLTSLELHNNPWNCNCSLKSFRDWTIRRKLYTHPTTCDQPAHLAGKMWDEVESDDFACPPEILSIGPSTQLRVGDGSAILTCRVAGIPRPQVSWLYRSMTLDNRTRLRGSGENRAGYYLVSESNEWSNLTIPNVTVADKGEYVCSVTSPGGTAKRSINLSVVGDANGGRDSAISLPLALGLGVTALLLLLLVTLILCACYCRRRRRRHDEKGVEAASLEHHGLGEQEKSLITAINPVVKPPRRYEAPSVTSHGTEMTELNRTLLDNDSVFAGVGGGVGGVGGVGVGADDERERATPELDSGGGGTLIRGASYRQYPPDLLAFSGGRGASPTSQASTVPDSSRLSSAPFGSPTAQQPQYPAAFKTLPHQRSAAPYGGVPVTAGGVLPVMPRHGYVTIPRRPRAPSWSSGPPTSPVGLADGLEPVYDNLGRRTTADGSSVQSLNKSPEPAPGPTRIRALPATPASLYNSIQRSASNILTSSSPVDRAAPEGAPEWPSKLVDGEADGHQILGGTLGRKVPPRPPPKPKKKSTNGPTLYEDEGEDGTEV